MSTPDLTWTLERMDRALFGLPDGAVRADIEQAIALARFQVNDPSGGPFHQVSFGPVPVIPVGPMFPRLDPSPLADALDEFQRALVWAADCAEFSDANLNSAQYLRAAGYLDRVAERLAPGE